MFKLLAAGVQTLNAVFLMFVMFFSHGVIFQRFCADIISVLGMTFSDNKESLKYRLLGSKESIGSWGHEYVRYISHLSLI